MNYIQRYSAENQSSITKTASRVLNIIVIGSLISSLIVWLPIVRIIGKPREYYWGLLGYHGEGANGPYWIFFIGFFLVIYMFIAVYRLKNRVISYILLLLWQVIFNGIISFELVDKGLSSTIQGQGWDWEFPIWILGIPSLLILLLTIYWVYLDYKFKLEFAFKPWVKKNTILFFSALALFILAAILFHFGDNYNWVTALAILTTITQWIILIDSFKPYNKG